MTELRQLEVPIAGMDCAECSMHVQSAIAKLPGVARVEVYLAAEKAVVQLDPALVGLGEITRAVEDAGYHVPHAGGRSDAQRRIPAAGADFARRITTLLGLVFGAILVVVVIGEWLGVFEALTGYVPLWGGIIIVLAGGWPVFRGVIRAALHGQIIAHTLMSLGVIAALAVGQWATAALIVFFMRIGDYTERFTTESARRAVRDLAALAPQTARVEREGLEIELPVGEVRPGEVILIRPGEQIPVDGEVLSGQATVDQAAITGEAMPVEAGPGTQVFAASIARLGSLRVRAARTGSDTTFGRVIRLVEEAEANRANVQRSADRFSARFLPLVVTIAALTFLVRRDPLATAAVLVVACSCSIALATPIAMLASIGAGARRGLLIKGGRVLESLAHADVVLIDKTGTLTLGKPQLTDVVALNGFIGDDMLALAAAAEHDSEHPLGRAVRESARMRGLVTTRPESFAALPGLGVRAVVGGREVAVGSANLAPGFAERPESSALAAQGKTLLFVSIDGVPAGILAAADTLRPEVPAALAELRRLGIQHIELLTGDSERAAAPLAEALGVPCRAGLLPEDKIAVVKAYQADGHTVVMVGDGVNDAPALAQAEVGIAMGAAGSDIAIEAAHLALLRDDWELVPQALHIAKRTMGVVRMNLAFTAVYNLAGLSLAALGVLPPMLAAAAQSLPDLGILANSSRLIRQR